MLTREEEKELYRTFRYLVRWFHGSVEQEKLRTVYNHFSNLYRAGILDRDEHQMHILIQSMGDALIVAKEIGLGTNAVLALLYYHAIKRDKLKLSDLKSIVGEDVVRLISLLLKTSELYSKANEITSDHFHNLLLAIAQDIQVVLLIIADRLNLLRHAKRLIPASYAYDVATEAMMLYAPMAHKLGLYAIKGELEDLSLKYTDRKSFDYIKRKLGETKRMRDEYIQSFIQPVKATLKRELGEIPFEIKGRTKSISSIQNKLKKQKFDDIYDLFAIRIIVDVPRERERAVCWQVYSYVTNMFQPNPERLKDWISIPKSNGYESLHTTVMGPGNKWVEVQIRTKRMDEIAECGVAAHWRYKGVQSQNGLDEYMSSVREVLEALREKDDATEKGQILNSSVLLMPNEEIYVFTPLGAVVKLPKDATVLDFAFAIHSKVGAHAVSAKVNGKNVPIKYVLHNGDTIEVITNAQQSPKADWLNIVVSARSKTKIRQILRAEEESGIGVAKELVNRRMKNRRLTYDDGIFIKLTKKKGYKTLSDFYRDVASEHVSISDFLDEYEAESATTEQQITIVKQHAEMYVDDLSIKQDLSHSYAHSTSTDVLILDKNLTGVEYSLAQCCKPIFGDDVFGFVSNRGIKIHRTTCPNAPDLISRFSHRMIQARWSGEANAGYHVMLEIIGRDDLAVVTNIMSVIKKENKVTLRAYNIDSADSLFKGVFTLEVFSKEQLTILIRKLNAVVGVKQIHRL